ncbi:MAG: putative Ig domain-containing protein [Pseudomonadota bacterium]
MYQRTIMRHRSLLAMAATSLILAGCIDDDDDDTDLAAALDPGQPAPVNSPPTISGFPPLEIVAGTPYSFRPTASDPDGDTLYFSVSNAPTWADFDVTTGELSGTPGPNDVGTVANVSIFVSDGTASAGIGPFRINVRVDQDTNRVPVISGTAPAGVTVGSTYTFQPTATDADNHPLSFSISNRPRWAQFDSNTGRLSGTPSANNVGTYNDIRISVSDGLANASLAPFSITVAAAQSANRPPSIGGSAPSMVTVGTAYVFRPSASDPDNDTLSFSVANRPSWLQFNASSGQLSGTPSANDVGTYNNIRITVSDGQANAATAAFSITVVDADPPNRAPVIGGTPATAATVGTPYSFQPNASDADNDTLSFSIANRPSWLQFNTATGRLSGTPGANNVRTFNNIRISVSDGNETVALPAFSITVREADAPNAPPQISGSPPAEAMVDQPYSFQPTASDADDDPLTFSIANRPGWLQFDATTGGLSGTPSAGDVGTYDNIVITVTDGTDSVDLPAFSITVVQSATGSITLSWSAPTENSDGTPLNDLAGYKIYYGTQSGNYTTTIDVNDAGLTAYVIEELVAGTYYIVATSVNSAGVESLFSAEVTEQVTTN